MIEKYDIAILGNSTAAISFANMLGNQIYKSGKKVNVVLLSPTEIKEDKKNMVVTYKVFDPVYMNYHHGLIDLVDNNRDTMIIQDLVLATGSTLTPSKRTTNIPTWIKPYLKLNKSDLIVTNDVSCVETMPNVYAISTCTYQYNSNKLEPLLYNILNKF